MKNKFLFGLIFLVLFIVFCGVSIATDVNLTPNSSISKNLTNSSNTELALLSSSQPLKLAPPVNGVYVSAFPYFGNEEDQVTATKVTDFETLVGKDIVWAMFSENWGTSGIKFPEASVRAINSTGAIPYIRLMPRTVTDEYVTEDTYTLQNIIDGDFDAKLKAWAQTSKVVGIPVMVEFGCEMNGDWFQWSGVNNGGATTNGYGDPNLADGPEKYRDAYRHIIDIFRGEGADNITYVFHPDANSYPEEPWNNMSAYYPGDNYIDWIGCSAYGPRVPGEAWEGFTSIMDVAYPEMVAMSPTKPLAILEYGAWETGDGKKAQWITDALQSIKNNRYPRVKALSYWHEQWENNDGSISDLRINSSPESLAAYKNMIADNFFVSKPNFNGAVTIDLIQPIVSIIDPANKAVNIMANKC
jgi:hypothetical protein